MWLSGGGYSLECIGVASGCCCKEVHSYINFLIIITYLYTPLVLALFFAAAAASLLLCSFKKCFFILVYVIFVQYSKLCSNDIRHPSKTEIMQT